MRHFIIPLFSFAHPKGAYTTNIALVNRKRGMPPKLAQWEGALSLFGGAAQEGETPRQTIHREVIVEGELGHLAQTPGIYAATAEYGGFTATPFFCTQPWTQQLYREFAATCDEGILDWVQANSTDWLAGPWGYPDMLDAVLDAMAGFSLHRKHMTEYALPGTKE